MYSPAAEVSTIADRIIREFYPHLEGMRLELAFRSKPIIIAGVPVAARVRRVSGLAAYLARRPGNDNGPPFAAIEIDRHLWTHGKPEWKIALIDSRLASIQTNKHGQLTIIGSPSAEFTAIIRRRGAWNRALREIVNAANEFDARQERRLQMDDDADAASAVPAAFQ